MKHVQKKMLDTKLMQYDEVLLTPRDRQVAPNRTIIDVLTVDALL